MGLLPKPLLLLVSFSVLVATLSMLIISEAFPIDSFIFDPRLIKKEVSSEEMNKTQPKEVVKLVSLIPGVSVSMAEPEKLDDLLESFEIWSKGIRDPLLPSRRLVQPHSVKFVLVGALQSRARSAKEIERGVVRASTSMDFTFNEDVGNLTIIMHYNPEYLLSLSNLELENEITKDLNFYLYLIAGQFNYYRFNERDLYRDARTFSNKLGPDERWVLIKRDN